MIRTPKITLLKDAKANDDFFEKGFARHGQISTEALNEILELNRKLSIPDYFGCGFNVGMNTDQKNLRRMMQDELKKIITPFTDQLLNDFSPYTASFLNKLPRNDCFVIAHQDFSYTNEDEYPSFMCFIPLVDTTLHNAALGFIPGSQLYYDDIRAFPFPGVPTATTENCADLMPYFDIQFMKAGEMVFFNHDTIHGSFSNYSDSLRPAVGLSFLKNGVQPYLFLHNPATNGKTILKFEVDTYSLVDYNNPTIKSMYESGVIDLPYKMVDEINYQPVDTSWESIYQKLQQNNLKPNAEYIKLVDKYKKIEAKKRQKSLFHRIKEKFAH